MASEPDELDENFRKAWDFLGPKVDVWMNELSKGFEAMRPTRPQKDMFQGLTIETMMYNTLMPNDEIIAVLAGIIQNIATRHSYVGTLDWGTRAELYKSKRE